jgi:hypothetical protein
MASVFGTGAVRDCCSHRPANDVMPPPVPGAYLTSWRVSAFAPARPPSPPPPPLVDSVVRFAPMLGCFTSWYRVWAPSHFVFVSFIATLVGIILLVSFTNCKTRRWYRSITIEITILLHAMQPSLGACSHSFFKNSLYRFYLLCLVPFFFFFLLVPYIYPLFFEHSGCNRMQSK